jgi:hypothetical protein
MPLQVAAEAKACLNLWSHLLLSLGAPLGA